MNEAMLQMLRGDKNVYPHQLEAQFPRVFNKLIALWNSPDIEEYFQELMVSSRQQRQGFPPEVATEIYRLSLAYDSLHPKEESAEKDIWASVEPQELRVIESNGFKFSRQGFLKSAESGSREVIFAFLLSGADVDTSDERGWTPLMISAFNGNEDVARFLIENGADIHVRDSSGYSPIHWAAFNGYTEIVKLLIAKHADVDAQSKHGWTALLQAATRGHAETCMALIVGRANVNLASEDGWTPLHKASVNGHIEVVKILLAAGADKSAQYQDGSTPLMLAERAQHQGIIKLLKAAQQKDAERKQRSSATSPDKLKRKVRVLLADDEEHIRALLRLIVIELGAEVVGETGDGEQALALFKQLKPDMVMLDINMPKLDGISVLKQIKAISPRMLVIMLTSLNAIDVVKECIENGAQNYILKNTSAQELYKTISDTWAEYLAEIKAGATR